MRPNEGVTPADSEATEPAAGAEQPSGAPEQPGPAPTVSWVELSPSGRPPTRGPKGIASVPAKNGDTSPADARAGQDDKPTADATSTKDSSSQPAVTAQSGTNVPAKAAPSTEPEQTLSVRSAALTSSADVAQHVPEQRSRRTLIRATVAAAVVAVLTAGTVLITQLSTPKAAEVYWKAGTTVTRTPTPSGAEETAEASESPSPSPSASPTPTAPRLTSVGPRTEPPPPRDRVVGTPAPPPPSPTPTDDCPPPFPSSGDPQPGTLEWYLAQVPCFPPAPPPAPVTLSHEEGRAAWIMRVPTSQPVAFITVDDGYWTEELTRELILRTRIPVASFLTWDAIADDIAYFKSIMHSGMVADNHTTTHPDLIDLTYEEQVAEICTAQDLLGEAFGRRPTNMRAPQLLYNDDTLRAAWDCGISVVVDGTVSSSGGQLYYRSPTLTLEPGDIIILHYDPEFADHFILALRAIHAAGLTPALLTDYLTPLQ
mgnify:CR=1 FL=1|jgi:peptidoglycan/xylan/chitin deacetylase (PgdA/CDA1 family)